MNSNSIPDNLLMIHQFYNDAFTDLLIIVGMILTFAGILMPIGIALLQSRQQKRESELARKEIKKNVDEVSRQIEERLKEEQAKALSVFSIQSQALLNELKTEIGRKLSVGEARAFHLQANLSTSPKEKAESAIAAVGHYLKGKHYRDLRTASSILIGALENLDKKTLAKNELGKSCEALIETLQTSDQRSHLADVIADIREGLDDALERVQESSTS